MRSWLNKGDKNRFSNSTKMNHFAMGIRQALFQLGFQPSLINLTKENFLPLDNQCHGAVSFQTGPTGILLENCPEITSIPSPACNNTDFEGRGSRRARWGEAALEPRLAVSLNPLPNFLNSLPPHFKKWRFVESKGVGGNRNRM